MATPHIALLTCKRSEFDRGTKKVLVDGEHWGWVTMEGHGSNGVTYLLHDLHGAVQQPAPTDRDPTKMKDVTRHSAKTRNRRI